MGSFNATCSLSRVQITAHDDVYGVSLTENIESRMPRDRYTIIPFPLCGKYNDSGDIEDYDKEDDAILRRFVSLSNNFKDVEFPDDASSSSLRASIDGNSFNRNFILKSIADEMIASTSLDHDGKYTFEYMMSLVDDLVLYIATNLSQDTINFNPTKERLQELNDLYKFIIPKDSNYHISKDYIVLQTFFLSIYENDTKKAVRILEQKILSSFLILIMDLSFNTFSLNNFDGGQSKNTEFNILLNEKTRALLSHPDY